MTLRDGLAAILVVTILGLAFVAIKAGLETVPPLMLCALRFGFAALPAALVIRPPRAPMALVAGFGLALGVGQFGLLMTAIRFGMPAGLSSLLIQVQVPLTVALAWAVQKERPRGLQVVGAGSRSSASPRWRSSGAGAPRRAHCSWSSARPCPGPARTSS